MRFLFLAALAVSLTASASAQVASLPPVDQGTADPSFIAFRAKLLAAAAAHDSTTLFAAFAPEATVSFGGESGPEGIRELWFSPHSEHVEDFYTAFARTVAMGSTVTGEMVSAPYLFMGFPDVDPFTHVAVVGEDVRVRSGPSLQDPVSAFLTYQVVPTSYDETGQVEADGYTWVPIQLVNGDRGWVAETFVWSPLGLRAGFEKADGSWRIVYFVEGD